MTTDEFINWLGLMYLDFDNESEEYQEIVRKEIKEQLKLLKQ